MSHRFALASSSTTSHLRMSHTTRAVKNADVEYTSASTAENQNESEKVKANAPTSPAPISVMVCSLERSSSLRIPITFLPNSVIDQKRNRIVKAPATTLSEFIQ